MLCLMGAVDDATAALLPGAHFPGIEVIYALSPQAKGRVERLWGTLQHRLVSEFRLAGGRTAAQANALLELYRPEHNRRFAIRPAEGAPAWRVVRRGTDLERGCRFYYEATVSQRQHRCGSPA